MPQLTLSRQVSKPVADIFKAWSDPNLMRQWFAPGDMTVPEIAVDFRVGGQYRIVMQKPDGERHIVVGEYLQIDPYKRIEFSWQWEGSPTRTRVVLTFKSVDANRSEFELLHRDFADDDARDHHQQGWNGCLANFDRFIGA